MSINKQTNDVVVTGTPTTVELQAAVAAVQHLVETLKPLQASQDLGQVPLETVHALVEAAVRVYGAVRVESGERVRPIAQDSGLSATHVAMIADGLLVAADMDVFELTFFRSMGRY